ncbi:MAG: TRAP transporter large permease subunit [Pseudomonadota bacterium]
MVSVTEDVSQKPVGATVNTAVDHFSRFAGLAVGNLYLIAAACTLWEVYARYMLNDPTQWVFEVVMVLCACAWMLSAGFVTLQKRHIGITVFYLMASDRVKWWLDLFAMVVGVFALYMLVGDTLIRALESIDLTERAGTAWNSPQPMILKTVLFTGLFIYLVQLLVNLGRHFQSKPLQVAVLALLALMCLRFLVQVLAHYGGYDSAFAQIDNALNETGGGIVDNFHVDRDAFGIGLISMCIVAALLALMMTGMPLGIVTLIISVVCAMLFYGNNGLYLVSVNALDLLEKYPLVAVPFFVLMASVLERSGIARDLFDAMSIFAGGFRGGVALQTTIVAVILAAMSGVMGGEIVMLGLVALPQMLRLGYDRKLTIGLICASGALATLIPPSIVMIVYGLSANVGIGDLFSAGFIPGLMLATFYVIYVLIRVNINSDLAPTAAEIAQMTGTETKLGMNQAIAVALSIGLIAIVMTSIYRGVASVTEASAVGATGALLILLARNHINWTRNKVTVVLAVCGAYIAWQGLSWILSQGGMALYSANDGLRDLTSFLGHWLYVLVQTLDTLPGGIWGELLVAMILFYFFFRVGQVPEIRDCLANTMTIVGTIIWLILGAVAFVGLYNLIGGADFMRSLISGTGLSALGTIFLMMAILVVLGTFMEWIAIIFITVPIFAPVVIGLTPDLAVQFGLAMCDGDVKTNCLSEYWVAVWFGVLFVMNIQIYFLSPPFGPACFWLKSVVPQAKDMPDGKEITLQEIFLSVLPFIGLQITGMLLVLFFPFIALWMPQYLGQ